jgi:hypothetical protein
MMASNKMEKIYWIKLCNVPSIQWRIYNKEMAILTKGLQLLKDVQFTYQLQNLHFIERK